MVNFIQLKTMKDGLMMEFGSSKLNREFTFQSPQNRINMKKYLRLLFFKFPKNTFQVKDLEEEGEVVDSVTYRINSNYQEHQIIINFNISSIPCNF